MTSWLLLVVLAVLPTIKQDVRVLDLTSRESDPTFKGIGDGCGSVGTAGPRRPPPSLAVTVRLDTSEVGLKSASIGYELEIQNVGTSSLTMPWSRSGNYSVTEGIDARLSLMLEHGTSREFFAGTVIRGVSGVPGSTVTLGPGQRATVKLREPVFLRASQLNAITKEAAPKVSLRGEVQWQYAPCKWEPAILSKNAVGVTIRR